MLGLVVAAGLVACAFIGIGIWLARRGGAPSASLNPFSGLGGNLSLPASKSNQLLTMAPFDRFTVSSTPVLISGQDRFRRRRQIDITADQDIIIWHSKIIEPGGNGILVTSSTPGKFGPIAPEVEIWAVRSTGSDANVGVHVRYM